MKNDKKAVLFVWENFGPLHIDRVASCVENFGQHANVVAVELFSFSSTYDWNVNGDRRIRRHTLFPGKSISEVGSLRRFLSLIFFLIRYPRSHVIFCHYERLETFFSALVMRMLLSRVYVMNVSKFDDIPRKLWKEVVKWVFHLPYQGGISSGGRASDYMRFLGIPKNRIFEPYNSISIDRFKSTTSGVEPLFSERDFVIVSRFVEKKNLFLAIEAFAFYRHVLYGSRRLILIGSGGLLELLREHAVAMKVDDQIDWKGFVQSDEVSFYLKKALALILVSKEEQFGNVVIEAMALGIPCIVSGEVGARDLVVRTNVNGYVVESDNYEGLARFMMRIDQDEGEWCRLSGNTADYVRKFDSSHFATAVKNLIGLDL